MKILLLDNFDSFTWNLAHYLMMAGAEVTVMTNDQPVAETLIRHRYDGILLGPGPCTPAEAGCMMQVISQFHTQIPLLGVCLGHQALGMYFGWNLRKAEKPVHGKAHHAVHMENGLFTGISNPMQIGRYHSLIVEEPEQQAVLVPAAWCGKEVMALYHKELPVWGVQFHPESVLTTEGLKLIKNWLASLTESNG